MVAIFASSEIEGYVLECVGLFALFYWFIFRQKLSEGWTYAVNALGFFCIPGIMFWQIWGTPFMTSNWILMRIQGLPHSAHFWAYFPVMVMALWLSLKYRDSVIGCLTMLAVVAIHESIFSVFFYTQRGLTTAQQLTGPQWELVAFSAIPGNFMFAIVMFIVLRYVRKDVADRRIWWAGWAVYSGLLSAWAFAFSFPVTLDTFNMTSLLSPAYNSVPVNFVEIATWWQPLAFCLWAFWVANPEMKAADALGTLPRQAEELYLEVRGMARRLGKRGPGYGKT